MAAIVQQLAVADLLIEQRMKFEDLFVQINRLPPHDLWSEFERQGGDKFQSARADADKALSDLFKELVTIEQCLDKANPDLLSKPEDKKSADDTAEDDDEQTAMDSDQGYEDSEIAEEDADYLEYVNEGSDANDEEEEEEEEEQLLPEDTQMDDDDDQSEDGPAEIDQLGSPELEDSTDFAEEPQQYLTRKHESLNAIRNEILDFWFQKTRYTLKGGKLDKSSLDSFEQSTVRSIEFALQNRLKLIRRTQLKRSKYQILGRPPVDEDEPKSELVERKTKEIYEAEIFDDSDFYHQLLRELIGSLGPNTTNASNKVNPKWLKLMNERFKTKKAVDTKATKARKIRYKVHDELVNFTTPMPHLCTYDTVQTNHLFQSLFGNRPTAPDQDDEDEDEDSDDE
jgi:protein AATF/BFR2